MGNSLVSNILNGFSKKNVTLSIRIDCWCTYSSFIRALYDCSSHEFWILCLTVKFHCEHHNEISISNQMHDMRVFIRYSDWSSHIVFGYLCCFRLFFGLIKRDPTVILFYYLFDLDRPFFFEFQTMRIKPVHCIFLACIKSIN